MDLLQRRDSRRKAWGAAYRHVVPGITVDKLMYTLGLGHIDILKIDIEGAEREVFWDTSRWLDKVNAIVIELHEHL